MQEINGKTDFPYRVFVLSMTKQFINRIKVLYNSFQMLFISYVMGILHVKDEAQCPLWCG